ncbi:MAG: hypothetical protein RL701_5423 [Pseudomonadota bacterium]
MPLGHDPLVVYGVQIGVWPEIPKQPYLPLDPPHSAEAPKPDVEQVVQSGLTQLPFSHFEPALQPHGLPQPSSPPHRFWSHEGVHSTQRPPLHLPLEPQRVVEDAATVVHVPLLVLHWPTMQPSRLPAQLKLLVQATH